MRTGADRSSASRAATSRGGVSRGEKLGAEGSRSGARRSQNTVGAVEPNRATSARRATGSKVRDRARSEAERFASNKKGERLQKQRTRTLRRSALVIGLITVTVLVGWGTWSLINSPFFAVEQVVVEGQRAIDANAVRDAVANDVDTTLFRVSSANVEELIMELPWVASVEVKKRLPSTIAVTIVERTPAATVTIPDGTVWVVSTDGFWLGAVAGSATIEAGESSATAGTNGLPAEAEGAVAPAITVTDPAGAYPPVTFDPANLVGIFDTPSPKPAAGRKVASAEVRNAVAVLAGLSAELRDQVERVKAPEVGSTSLIIESGVELVVGSADDMLVKDKVILSILKAHEGNVSLINVRTVNNPTWRGLDSK